MTSNTVKIPTDPKTLLTWLEWQEVSPERAVDCRRVLRAERQRLALALRSGNRQEIAAARDEARRVAEMWEGR